MNDVAREYVQLVLALGVHDADYVDAYYGPPAWRTRVEADAPSLEEIRRRAGDAVARLAEVEPETDDPLLSLRRRFLATQLRSLKARARMVEGEVLSFDEESRALYDAVAPMLPARHFDSLIAELDDLLPGRGSIPERYHAYRSAFVIPADRLDRVFSAAIAECRTRTRRHIPLPREERFTVEYVTDQAWSAYNWYRGGYRSLIQVNTDLPIYIDRAVDLACHEGYPGHHVYNTLLEQHLVRGRDWVEYSVYPLFSPQSLIAEGSANFGIEMAFPDSQRTVFERDVLYPLAGLPPERAAAYRRVQDLVGRLGYAGNEAARAWLDGAITDDEAANWLERYALMSAERARQRLQFIEQYRSYVINYNLGQDLVRDYVNGGPDTSEPVRWARFAGLLASPRLPADLRVR